MVSQNIENSETIENRNSGLDLLRVLSMLMIVTLHYLAKGGVLWNTTEWTLNWFLIWIIEAFCYTSVNCYVLISAYFLSASERKFNRKKLLELLVTMWVYSIGISVILAITGKTSFSIKDIICCLFPFVSKSYWFMNVYILLYILHPYLNKLIAQMDQKEYWRLLVVLVSFFSLAQSVIPFTEWTLDETHGYGILWFTTLYFVGGYIRKYQIHSFFGRTISLFVLGGGICCIGRIVLLYLTSSIGRGEEYVDIWYAYNSIPVFLGSLGLFLFFLNVRTRNWMRGKCVGVFTKGTLGVYLLHEQYKLRQILWKDLLHVDWFYNSWIQLLHIMISVLAVYCIGIFVDACKRKLFGVIKKTNRGGEFV